MPIRIHYEKEKSNFYISSIVGFDADPDICE